MSLKMWYWCELWNSVFFLKLDTVQFWGGLVSRMRVWLLNMRDVIALWTLSQWIFFYADETSEKQNTLKENLLKILLLVKHLFTAVINTWVCTWLLCDKSVEWLRAGFTKLWPTVKLDLTGRFDENLIICVSPTFIWPSIWQAVNA